VIHHSCVLAIFLLNIACVNHISSPTQAIDPVQIYLVDHGRHPSIILPREGAWTRYAYGDWSWYAVGQENLFTAISAMLWPTQAALGRREFPANWQPLERNSLIREGFVKILPLMADGKMVAQLSSQLEEIFAANQNQLLLNPTYNLEFVPHPRSYWFAHQSNQVMAQWLRELGFHISGSNLLSNWEIN